jgi:hypothetical protein
MRRILAAFTVFALAGGALALEAKKKPEKPHPTAKTKEKPRAKKFLPVKDFGDY